MTAPFYDQRGPVIIGGILRPILDHWQAPADFDIPAIISELIDEVMTPQGPRYGVDPGAGDAWQVIESHRHRPLLLPADYRTAAVLLWHGREWQPRDESPSEYADRSGLWHLIEARPGVLARASILTSEYAKLVDLLFPYDLGAETWLDPYNRHDTYRVPLDEPAPAIGYAWRATRLAWVLMRPPAADTRCSTLSDGTHVCDTLDTLDAHALAPWIDAYGKPVNMEDGNTAQRLQAVIGSTARSRAARRRGRTQWIDRHGRAVIEALA